jgi:S1-C subfamily serine protease
MDDPKNTVVMPFEMDRVWFPVRRCARDDDTGLWPCRDLGPGPLPSPPVMGSTRFAEQDDPRVNAIAPSLVVVTFDLPYTLSGVAERHYYGTGIVVDAERGLVIVDRNTVPIAIGDVTVTFAGSLEVKAKIEQVHPLHNLAIVSYDPATIGETPVKAAVFEETSLRAGEQVWVVGIKADHQLVHQQSTVASVDPLILPLSRTLRFRDSNIEVVSLVNGPQDFDGVIVDKRGHIVSTWSSFDVSSGGEAAQINRGIPSEIVTDFVATMREERPFYSLDAELTYAPLFAARNLGMSEDWLERLELDNPGHRRAMLVTRVVAGSPAADVLRNGDILLSVDGTVVTSFSALEDLTRKPAIKVAVWRDGKALEIPVATASLSGRDIDHAVSWAGALLQDPHRPMAAQRGIPSYGVYVAYFSYGSPATRYGLWAGRRIVQVDDTPTPDLEAFIGIVSGRKDQASVRLTTVTWNGAVEVITLKLDNQYWPAYEIRRTADNGWVRTSIDG